MNTIDLAAAARCAYELGSQVLHNLKVCGKTVNVEKYSEPFYDYLTQDAPHFEDRCVALKATVLNYCTNLERLRFEYLQAAVKGSTQNMKDMERRIKMSSSYYGTVINEMKPLTYPVKSAEYLISLANKQLEEYQRFAKKMETQELSQTLKSEKLSHPIVWEDLESLEKGDPSSENVLKKMPFLY